MNNKESFDRDDLTRRIVQKAGMEEPSFNFTQKIMGKILVPQSPEVFVYKPVISKKAWIILTVVLLSAGLLLMFMPGAQTQGETDLEKYIAPAQHVLNKSTSGFIEKLAFLNSLSWLAVVIVAGWLLFAADKLLRRGIAAA